MLETQSLIVILLIGLIAGFLAGKIMKGSGFGIVGDIIADLNDRDEFVVPDPNIAAIAFVGMLRQVLRFLPKPWPDDLSEKMEKQFLFGVCPGERRAAKANPTRRPAAQLATR